MLLTGRKLVGGGVFQTKIMETTSTDGIAWAGAEPGGQPVRLEHELRLLEPELARRCSTTPAAPSPYKLYYSGNTIDANGNFHTRIGLATSSDGNVVQQGQRLADAAARCSTSARLEPPSMRARRRALRGRRRPEATRSSPASTGARAAATSSRGSARPPRPTASAWTKVPARRRTAARSSAAREPGPFDNGGERDPSVLYDAGDLRRSTSRASTPAAPLDRLRVAPEDGSTKQPDNSTWSSPARSCSHGDGVGLRPAGVAHPSVIKDGADLLHLLHRDSTGRSKIGRATVGDRRRAVHADAAAVLDAGSARAVRRQLA